MRLDKVACIEIDFGVDHAFKALAVVGIARHARPMRGRSQHGRRPLGLEEGERIWAGCASDGGGGGEEGEHG